MGCAFTHRLLSGSDEGDYFAVVYCGAAMGQGGRKALNGVLVLTAAGAVQQNELYLI